MEERGSNAMVQKILTIILILSHTSALASEAPASGLLLRWRGEKTSPCQKLVETFLTELRSMASDRVIELEAVGKTASTNHSILDLRPLDMQCVSHGVQIIEEDHSLVLHYLDKALGYDALDWIPFQERYLRGPKISLAPRPPLPVSTPEPTVNTVAAVENIAPKMPLVKRWWFWGIVAAAVGGGIYALTQSGSNASNVDVEIQ